MSHDRLPKRWAPFAFHVPPRLIGMEACVGADHLSRKPKYAQLRTNRCLVQHDARQMTISAVGLRKGVK